MSNVPPGGCRHPMHGQHKASIISSNTCTNVENTCAPAVPLSWGVTPLLLTDMCICVCCVVCSAAQGHLLRDGVVDPDAADDEVRGESSRLDT